MKFNEENFLDEFIEHWTDGNDTGTMPSSEDLWEFLDTHLKPDIDSWVTQREDPIRERLEALEHAQKEYDAHVKAHSGAL